MFQICACFGVIKGCVPPEGHLRLGFGLPWGKLDPGDIPSSSLSSSEITSGAELSISVTLCIVRGTDTCWRNWCHIALVPKHAIHAERKIGVEAEVCAGKSVLCLRNHGIRAHVS